MAPNDSCPAPKAAAMTTLGLFIKEFSKGTGLAFSPLLKTIMSSCLATNFHVRGLKHQDARLGLTICGLEVDPSIDEALSQIIGYSGTTNTDKVKLCQLLNAANLLGEKLENLRNGTPYLTDQGKDVSYHGHNAERYLVKHGSVRFWYDCGTTFCDIKKMSDALMSKPRR
ncbi:hypothetical protein HG531_013713 [Fusarium graminearum]|nr:hypothetical protein HG531_013713 [Fusarium graminearum]